MGIVNVNETQIRQRLMATLVHVPFSPKRSVHQIYITPTSRKLQKKPLVVIMSVVEGLGDDSVTSTDLRSDKTPSQGLETEILSPL